MNMEGAIALCYEEIKKHHETKQEMFCCTLWLQCEVTSVLVFTCYF